MADQIPEPKYIVPFDNGKVKIHTFISPEIFLANATHIIESPNFLVMIDSQLAVPFAKKFRMYADGLGKPIKRLYISHAHVDHFFGIGAAFQDIEVYALPQTIEYIGKSGEGERVALAAVHGEFVPDKIVIPGNFASAGEETIDGVRYIFRVSTNAEADYQLSIELPDLGVYIVQDLIYSGLHLYITQNMDNWVRELENVKKSNCNLFLAGHGEPAGMEEVSNNIEYLLTAQKAFMKKSGPEIFKETLLKAFPDRGGAGIFDFYLPRLFS